MKTLDELLQELPPERRKKIECRVSEISDAVLRQWIEDEIEQRRY